MAIVRKGIRMSEDLANWYEERAKELGVSQSNLMIMALAQYIDQQKSINVMDKLQEMIKKMPRGE